MIFVHILFDVIIVTVLYYTLKNLKGYTDKIEEYKNALKENKDKIEEINKDLELRKEVSEYRSYMLYIALNGHQIFDENAIPRDAVTNKEIALERKIFTERWAERYNLREDSDEITTMVKKYCKLSQ